jgi:SAM-dependent methyltransferase
MKRTSERHHPDALLTAEDEAMDVRHRYAYSLVQRYATQGDRLLDVGSGEGYGAAIVSSWVTSYDGVDVSATAVAHAAKTYGAASVRFEHYDGRTLPYETDAFDLVVSFQVIEHVEDVDGYMREMHRVARPGARVLVTTPNRLLRLADGERPWNRYHRREYDPEALAAALAASFREVEIYGIRGSDSMEALERARVARARRLARLDRLGLRYVLPSRVDVALRALLRRHSESSRDREVDLATMRHTKDDLEHALDLLAIATL